jgi:ADP-heptose:LPS heptosyltransferase
LSPKDPPRTDLSRLRRILLIRLRRIGDIVLTTPAVRALRLALPEAEIVYVVEEPYRKLLEGHPDLDGIIIVGRSQTRTGFGKLVRKIRRKRFDAVLDFHGGPRASLLTWLSGAKLKIGYDIKWRGFIYGIRIPRRRDDGPIHSVENHVNLVRALGIDVGEIPGLALPPANGSPEAREKDGIGTILLHIGAGNRFRAWGADNLARLAALLNGIPGFRVILIGGPEDVAGASAILAGAPGTESLAGRCDLAELRDLMSRAAVFVGPDSGPMHIATAVGLPIVAWFGPTLPANFGPWKARGGARIIEKDLPCRPCRQHECLSGDYRCLRDVTPEEVRDAVVSTLRAGGSLAT